MADFNSSLPVRSEADGTDERLHVKIVDGATPSQRATVDTDNNVHVEVHTNDPAGVDRVLRSSELGALTPDGVYDVSTNTLPGNVGVIAHTRSASPGPTTQNLRATAVSGAANSVNLDVSIHDENGAVFSETNPLPVSVVESEGAAINDYLTSADVAAAASANHDYTVSAGKTLYLTCVSATASGKSKIQIQVETAVASGTFDTKFVMFNSTANPNMEKVLREPLAVAAGVRVRVVQANNDNQPQDLYSTIQGHEVSA